MNSELKHIFQERVFYGLHLYATQINPSGRMLARWDYATYDCGTYEFVQKHDFIIATSRRY